MYFFRYGYPFLYYCSATERNNPEVVVQRYSVKKVFLEISQNSQENTCARVSFLIKLQAHSINFKSCDTMTSIAHEVKYIYEYVFWIGSYLFLKLGQLI